MKPRHRVGSVGHQLDYSTALQAPHRVGIAEPTQNPPVQHLRSRQDLYRLQFLRRKGLQAKLKQIVKLAVGTQRTSKLPARIRADQHTTFPTSAQQAAQQHWAARSSLV